VTIEIDGEVDGELVQMADGWRVQFTRTIDRPPTRVWAALTDPAVLKNWIGDVDVELRVGGKYVIRFRDDSIVMTGVITALEPERLLEYSWLENYGMPQSKVRWEIEPLESGCRLLLKHQFPRDCRREQILPFLAGWHDFLDLVPEASDGTFVPYRYGYEKQLEVAYRSKYKTGEDA